MKGLIPRLTFWSDWTEWKQTNWIDMEIVRLHFERASYETPHVLEGTACWCNPRRDKEQPRVIVHNEGNKQTFEINAALLGFNLCVEWHLSSRRVTK